MKPNSQRSMFGDKEKKLTSPHHISFHNYDTEKSLKQYLLDQFDNLNLGSYFNGDYIMDIRDNFFSLLKNKKIEEIIKEFPDIFNLQMHDELDSIATSGKWYFLWINLNTKIGGILSLNVYNLDYDPSQNIFSVKLGDVVIARFYPEDTQGIFSNIILISEKVIDMVVWSKPKDILQDEYIIRSDEIRNNLLQSNQNLQKNLKIFQNKLDSYDLKPGMMISFQHKPSNLNKNINWEKINKNALFIRKVDYKKWKLIISDGVRKFSLKFEELENIEVVPKKDDFKDKDDFNPDDDLI